MLSLSPGQEYYLYREVTDMRKSFDGLAGLIRSELNKDPLSGDIFIFLNRRRNQIKLLLWEQDGFSLYYKRLEKGTYELPAASVNTKSIEVKSEDLLLILKGISLKHIQRRMRYKNTLYS